MYAFTQLHTCIFLVVFTSLQLNYVNNVYDLLWYHAICNQCMYYVNVTGNK